MQRNRARQEKLPNPSRTQQEEKTRPVGAVKWSSIHNTTTHSDEECYQQGVSRPQAEKDSSSKTTAKTFSTWSHCSHCSSSTSSSTTKYTCTEEEAAIDFTKDGVEFEGGFMYHATCSAYNSTQVFEASNKGTALLVDSGASESMFDDQLIPPGRITEIKDCPAPKTIDAAGQKNKLSGATTGMLYCSIHNAHGQNIPVRVEGLIVPGL